MDEEVNSMAIQPESQQILRNVIENGMIRGFELKRLSGFEPTNLINAVKPLIESQLITASGVVTPDTTDRVRFAPLSSSYEKSAFLLK
jgi:hypothetical protein